MKYHILAALYMLAARLAGWRVEVRGESCGCRGIFGRLVGTHRALSFTDALDWAACYGPRDYVVNVYRRGQLVSQRLPYTI